MKVESKNVRHLKVAPELLIAMCRSEPSPRYYAVTKNPLPADSVVVGITSEYNNGVLVMELSIESKEFTDNVPDPLPSVEFTQMIAIMAIGNLVSWKESE